MTPRQIELVQNSFHNVLPIADAAANLFYTRLFELDPSLRTLFRSDMKEQGRKLMDTLRAVVANLRSLDRLLPGLQAMARRHAGYGVKASDYATVCHALVDTLRKGLGVEFTREVESAWLAAYTILADTMIDASEAEEREPLTA